LSLISSLQEEIFYQDPNKFFEYVWNIYGYKPSKAQSNIFSCIKDMKTRIMVVSANGTGKTISLATIALYLTTVYSNKIQQPIKVLLIAGSWSQAHTLQEYVNHGLRTKYIKEQVEGEPTKTRVNFKNGSWILSATASDFQVFGKHVDALFIDEAVMVSETIINDAFSRIIGSSLGLIILSSTPEPKYYFSKFVNMWERRDEYPDTEWVRISIKASDCPWIKHEEIEEARKSLSEEEFNAKWLGIPSFTRISNVFSIKDLNECLIDEVKYIPEMTSVAGLDFGFFNPCAIVFVQKENDNVFIVHAEEWSEVPWSKQKKAIKRLITKYNTSTLYCDSTRPELIRDLQNELNCQVIPVPFASQKPSMQMNAGRLVMEHRLFIPREFKKLIQEMSIYTTTTKTNDDLVDALMLSLREEQLIPSSWEFIVKRERKLKFGAKTIV